MAKYSIVVTEVVQTGPYSLRVGFGGINRENNNRPFSAVPYLTNKHPSNALNKQSYIVKKGSTPNVVKEVKTVPDHFSCVELVMVDELGVGGYTLDIDLTKGAIENYAGVKVECLNSEFPTLYQFGTFYCKYMPPQAKQTTLEDTFRKYMSPILDGPNFRALVAALVSGEKYNSDNFQSAYNQLFVNKASSPYLERLGSDYGIYQSQNAEMDDNSFRRYVQTFYNKKITEEALYSMIEVFYGITSTRAYAKATVGLFTPNEESVFEIQLNGIQDVKFTIKDIEFTEYTKENVAMLIDRKLKEQQVYAHCDTDGDNIRLFSDIKGLRSSVEIKSKPSWFVLEKEQKWTLYSNPNPAYIGRDDQDYMQIFLPVISITSDGRNNKNVAYSDLNGVIQNTNQEYYPTAKYSTLSQAIPAGTRTKIEVVDGSQFKKGGWVIVGYGYGFQLGPIQYTRLDGSDTLTVTGMVVTRHVPAGVEVNEAASVVGESGYQNNSAQVDPAIAVGLLKKTLIDMIDVGTKYRINIYYPETTGLSDPTGVWG
jgi:hypothetical protein